MCARVLAGAACSQGNMVCLHVLPYNYPLLVKLLDQLNQMGSNMKMAPPIPWRQEFERCAGRLVRGGPRSRLRVT